jgi:hypothetical protein
MSCVFYSYILLIFCVIFVFNFITLSGSPQLQYMEDLHNAVVHKKRPSNKDDCRRIQNLSCDKQVLTNFDSVDSSLAMSHLLTKIPLTPKLTTCLTLDPRYAH